MFGYYIEVTKANIHNARILRAKQTLANAERFITPELKKKGIINTWCRGELPALNMNCSAKSEQVRDYIEPIQQNAYCLAMLDVLQSLRSVAVEEDIVVLFYPTI